METPIASLSVFALLGLGFVFGLKHAAEVDHIVAVSTIVSQHKNILRSAVAGALWGAGHTAALLITGTLVLTLRVAIPEEVGNWLELFVALMIVGLGISALLRTLRKGSEVHAHQHSHDGLSHVHIHFHEQTTRHGSRRHSFHSHAISRVGLKPLLVGCVHGLAGSGALTLLVLTQIASPLLGLLYLAIFGIGSVLGMLLMSGLIGLPFALTSRNLTSCHHGLQITAAVLSICFGLWYAYGTGFSAGLF